MYESCLDTESNMSLLDTRYKDHVNRSPQYNVCEYGFLKVKEIIVLMLLEL